MNETATFLSKYKLHSTREIAKKRSSKGVPVLNISTSQEHKWSSGGIAPLFPISALDGGGWFSFPPRPFYLRCPLDRRLGGSKGRSGSCVEGKIFNTARFRSRQVQAKAHRYTDWATLTPNSKIKPYVNYSGQQQYLCSMTIQRLQVNKRTNLFLQNSCRLKKSGS
jgi:hypothetical protein